MAGCRGWTQRHSLEQVGPFLEQVGPGSGVVRERQNRGVRHGVEIAARRVTDFFLPCPEPALGLARPTMAVATAHTSTGIRP